MSKMQYRLLIRGKVDPNQPAILDHLPNEATWGAACTEVWHHGGKATVQSRIVMSKEEATPTMMRIIKLNKESHTVNEDGTVTLGWETYAEFKGA